MAIGDVNECVINGRYGRPVHDLLYSTRQPL